MIVHGLSRMKFVAAYLLAVLAGNPSPSAEDLSAILESGKMLHFKDRNRSHVYLLPLVLLGLMNKKHAFSLNGAVYINWQFKLFV